MTALSCGLTDIVGSVSSSCLSEVLVVVGVVVTLCDGGVVFMLVDVVARDTAVCHGMFPSFQGRSW